VRLIQNGKHNFDENLKAKLDHLSLFHIVAKSSRSVANCGMAQKKINFGRTTIAGAKAAVKRHRAAKKKKGRSQSKRQSKQVELEPKLNAFLNAKLPSPMVEKNNSPKKRNLRVVKWLSSTPVVAVCTFCSREFNVPMSALSRTVDAQADLQQQSDRHSCLPEDAT
jgi:hypothetical protein